VRTSVSTLDCFDSLQTQSKQLHKRAMDAPGPNPVLAVRGRGGNRGRGRGVRGRGRGGRGGRGGAAAGGGGAPGAPVHAGVAPAGPVGPAPPAAPLGAAAAPPPHPAVFEPPVYVPPTRLEVIHRWLAAFRPKVARPMIEDVKVAFPGVDFIVDDPGVRGVNPHELLAVGRIIATVRAIAELALRHTTPDIQEIDFLWGANRDMMVLSTLNTVLVAAGHAPILGHLIGDQVLAADEHRRPVVPEGPHSPYGFMLNVYCQGLASTEITPFYLGSMGYKHLVWAGHRFDDLYGTLLTAHWLRVPGQDGSLIRWYADEVNPEYPPHPPCDLLHASGATASHQWHTVGTVTCMDVKGPSRLQKPVYDLVMVSARVAREAILCAVRESKQMVVELEVPDFTSTLAWIRSSCPVLFKPAAQWLVQGCYDHAADWVPKTKVVLQKGDFAAAVRFLSNKGRQQYSFRALQTEIERMLSEPSSHADFIYLEKQAPDFFLNYRWNLALAAFTHRAEDQAWQLRSVQAVYGASFDMANRAVKGLDAPVASAGSKTLGVYLLATIFGHLAMSKFAWYRAVIVKLFKSMAGLFAAVLTPASGGTMAQSVRIFLAILGKRLSNGYAAIEASDAVRTLRTRAAKVADIVGVEGSKARQQVAEIAVDAKQGWEFGRKAYVDAVQAAREQVNPLAAERVLGAVVTAPLVEEAMKQFCRRFGHKAHLAACAWMVVGDLANTRTPPITWSVRVPLLFSLHYWFSAGGYWDGVVKHCLWNTAMVSIMCGARYMGSLPMYEARATTAFGVWKLATMAAMAAALYAFRNEGTTHVEDTTVQRFDERWYAGPGAVQNRQELLVVEQDRHICPIPVVHLYVPPYTASGLPPAARDPSVSVLHVPTPFAAPEDNVGIGYFRIWGHNAPMFRPASSVGNMRAVIEHRLAKAIQYKADPGVWWLITSLFAGNNWNLPVGEWPIPSNAALAAWDNPGAPWPMIRRYDVGFQDLGALDRPQMNAAWLEHTDPAKRDRYLQAFEVVAHSPLAVNSKKVVNVQINVKKDEVLLKCRLTEADVGSVPRPIHNVDPMLAVTVGPDVFAASANIKRAWNWRHSPHQQPWAVQGKAVYLTYGAGLSAVDLDEWFEFVLSVDGWHILVAGDDSVVVIRGAGRITFVEGDISQCDHSVRLAALLFEYRVLVAGGIDARACWFLLANSSATCVAGSRMPDGGSVRLHRQAERNTGGVDTTVGNTVVTGGIHTFACAIAATDLDDEGYARHFKAVFAGAGLSLKARVWSGSVGDMGSTFYGPSFLKGYWYPTLAHSRWQWGPLPSRFLKISKIMTDPRRVYRLASESPISYEVAAARHVASLYAGLRPYVWPQELLGWLQARADPAWSKRVPIEEWATAWRPDASGAPSPVDVEWRRQAAWWYGCDEDEVEDWLAHLSRLQLLEFSCHPFWVRMALKDYN